MRLTKQETKDRDELFLSYLFDLGSVRLAAEELDISLPTARKIAIRNRDNIIENALAELALRAPKAVRTMTDAMDEDGSVAKGDIRLKAAGEVLDRIGAHNKQIEAVVVEATPVILMPVKQKQVTPIIIKELEE